MTDCIFCKIVNGEIPSYKVYEDDDLIAFLDIAPNNKGHTLVLPKQHHETILDIPDELLDKTVRLAKKVATALKQISDGVNIIQNNFKAAGQEIPHVHYHIIPRLEDDGFKFWPHTKYEEGEEEQYRQKIKSFLK